MHTFLDSSIDCLIGKLPLVLEPAWGIYSLKGSDSHNEIIKKCRWYFYKPSIHVINPSLINNEVLVRGLYIISIEDDLTEVDVCDEWLHAEGGIPPIVAFVDYPSGDVELNGVVSATWVKGTTDPETSDEEDYVVRAEWQLELGVGHSLSLLGVVDVILIVGLIALHLGYVDLDKSMNTMFPAV